MDDRELGEVLRLLRDTGKVAEPAHVTTFRGYREDATGAPHEVTFEISDAGKAGGAARYFMMARTADGRVAFGNPEPSLDLLFATFHWNLLDSPVPSNDTSAG